MTARVETFSRISYQIPEVENKSDSMKELTEHLVYIEIKDKYSSSEYKPISSALSGTQRLVEQRILFPSSLISIMLFTRAKTGASGKHATNIVINPYWITERGEIQC